MPKILVIGIDGATWDLLNPFLSENKLPNLLKIKCKGASGKLLTTIPPATGSCWPSFATGCYPSKHNVFDFVKFQKNHKTAIVAARDIKVPTIFEYVDTMGKKSIVINHPLTFGMSLERGMIFADFLSPKIYAYPKSAEKYLEDYRIFWNYNLFQSDFRDVTDDILDVEKKRLKLIMKLIGEEWDLFFVLFSGTDWISHKYFSEMEKKTEIGVTAFKVFEFVDTAIGKISEKITSDTIIIIMSDHGFHSKNYSFDINHWLASMDYLKYTRTKKKEKDVLLKLRDSQFEQHMKRLPLSFQMKNFVRKLTFNLLIDLNIMKEYTIDWDSSLAESPTHNCFGIYINKDNVVNYEDFSKELVEKLRNVIHPETGQKVFSMVDTTKNIYGKKPADAPDILFLLNKFFSHYCVTNFFASKKIETFSKMPCDDHSLFGIFLAYGDLITPKKLENISIVDIVPTILNMMGYLTPKEMDGKSFAKDIYRGELGNLTELDFSQKSEKLRTEIEKEKIKRKLKSLGSKI